MPVNLIPVEDYQAAPPPGETPLWNLPPPKPPKGELLIEYSDGKDASRNETIWNSLIRQATPLEEQFTKKISRVFFDMRKRTLEILYRQEVYRGFPKKTQTT